MIQDVGFCLRKIFFALKKDSFSLCRVSWSTHLWNWFFFSLKGKYPDIMLQSAYSCTWLAFSMFGKDCFIFGQIHRNWCQIHVWLPSWGDWIAWLVFFHSWDPICQSVTKSHSLRPIRTKKACSDELEKEEIRIKLVNEEGTNFNYISITCTFGLTL